MGKMRMGSGPVIQPRQIAMIPEMQYEQPVSVLPDIVDVEAIIADYFAKNPVVIPEAPLATMAPSCVCSSPAPVEPVVQMVPGPTIDTRVRQYAKGVREEMLKVMDRKHQLFNKVSELQRKKNMELEAKIVALESRKPEEKQVVVEKTVTTNKVPKIVVAGLVLSLILNVIALIK
jgi:hypothetical protein